MANPTTKFVEMRSNEVQELLSDPAPWITKWGSTTIFLILAAILTGTWLIQFPDVVHASLTLTSINAPKPVFAHSDGTLIKLLAKENMRVKRGDLLACLESAADHTEVILLSDKLHQAWLLAKKGDLAKISTLKLDNYHNLGEVQSSYQDFIQSYIKLQSYLANGTYLREKALLAEELSDIQALRTKLVVQQQLQEEDMKLAQEEFEAQNVLAKQKVIAPIDLKHEISKNLAKKVPYNQTGIELINNYTMQRTKQRQILAIDRSIEEERRSFLQALNSIQSSIDVWENKYLVKSPETGKVYFSQILEPYEHIDLNKELFYIVPLQSSPFGELRIPQQNFGKIKVGQKVIIKFAGYPYQEFGIVDGKITSIAEIPFKDSVFIAKVSLPNGLKTNSGYTLLYKSGITASAEVITKEKSLLQKLVFNF